MNWDQLLSALEPWGVIPSGIPLQAWRPEPYVRIYWDPVMQRAELWRWPPDKQPERRGSGVTMEHYMGSAAEVVEFFVQQEGDKRRAA